MVALRLATGPAETGPALNRRRGGAGDRTLTLAFLAALNGAMRREQERSAFNVRLAVAGALRVSPRTLEHWLSPHSPCLPSAEAVLAMLSRVDALPAPVRQRVLEWLDSVTGRHAGVAVDERAGTLQARLMRIAAAAGDLAREFESATDPGSAGGLNVTAEEARALLPAARAAVHRAGAMLAALEARAAGNGGGA